MGYGGGVGYVYKYFFWYYLGYLNCLIVSNNFFVVIVVCLFVKWIYYEVVKGLNEKDLIVVFNDVDFCLKVLEFGVRNFYCVEVELYYYELVFWGFDVSKEKMVCFNSEFVYLKVYWGYVIVYDLVYNLNLILWYENFVIKDEKERLKEVNLKIKI